MLKSVTASNLPSPVGPYSPGIAFGELVFVSGQSGREPGTGHVAPDVETQTEQALRNVQAILEAAGSDLAHVIRCGVFLIDMAEFPKMNAVYARMFGGHRPARTTVQVAGQWKLKLASDQSQLRLKIHLFLLELALRQ